MPKAAFYTHVAKSAVFSCRLATRTMRDSHVLVWPDSVETVARIDHNLWQFDPESFIPHEVWLTDNPVPSETSVLLVSGSRLPKLPHGFAVLNLSSDFLNDTPTPPVRMFKIVGTGLEELTEAQEQLKACRSRGPGIEHFDMNGKA